MEYKSAHAVLICVVAVAVVVALAVAVALLEGVFVLLDVQYNNDH